MNCPPPMLSWPLLCEKLKPTVSLTENAAPAGQQSHPTTMTSEDCDVDRDRVQAVTYPHPALALPSTDGGVTAVVVEDVDALVEVATAAGTRASVTAPESLPCEESERQRRSGQSCRSCLVLSVGVLARRARLDHGEPCTRRLELAACVSPNLEDKVRAVCGDAGIAGVAPRTGDVGLRLGHRGIRIEGVCGVDPRDGERDHSIPRLTRQSGLHRYEVRRERSWSHGDHVWMN